MESNYSNRDFEQYVKKNADEYRMFPSEKVWKGVHNALHARKRWPGFGLAFLLLLTGGAVTWVMTTYPVSKKLDDTALTSNTPVGKPEKSSENATQELKKILSFNQPNESKTISTETEGVSKLPLSDKTEFSIDATIFNSTPATDIAKGTEPALIRQESPKTSIVNNINKPEVTTSIAEQDLIADASLPAKNAVTGEKAELNHQPKSNPAPLTIESVANTYQYKAPKKKISWQVFFTPTVSYRKLSSNKSYENAASAIYPFVSLTDVNKAVTHKPDLGFQLGFSAGYPLGKSFKIRAGLQANVNRYDIKAFANNGEVATINLNSGAGTSSVSTWTHYRNYGGYKTDWIKNYYLSLSIPIGAEITLFGNKTTSFGVAGTIQPTYIVSDRAYLISTDYKNYAKVPWLIRHVNVSTGFETFVNYQSGKTKWQIGPQVRYQLLSSFENKYPVKENLFDFGLKVGIILNE